ncbi:MAG TPA: cupredoxin domain-containing protein [Candidatus Limnocylindria bacterium]
MKFPVRALALAGVLVIATVLAACGGSSPSQSATKVEVSAKEFMFEPDPIVVPANQVVEIVLTNDGVVEHDLTIESLGFALAVAIGETKTGQIGPLEPGTYEVHCAVVGHKEAGMTTTLTVE